jgi:hypothetical protein
MDFILAGAIVACRLLQRIRPKDVFSCHVIHGPVPAPN